MRVVSLRGVGVEEKRGHLVAVFVLSETPDPAWITFFRERGRYSTFAAADAKFHRNRVRIELPRREDLDQLLRSVESFISGANLDMEFRSPQ
jgi:hypothetical protein